MNIPINLAIKRTVAAPNRIKSPRGRNGVGDVKNCIFSGVLMMFEQSNSSQAFASSSGAAAVQEVSPFAELLLNPALGARRMTVAAGKVLYEPSAEAKAVFFVHRGQVRTYRHEPDGNGRLLDILGPEDWCGEAALARHPAYGERASAVVPSIVTEVAADRLLQVLAQQPRAAMEMVKQLAGKLSASRADAAGLVFDDCNSRLLKTLVRFSESSAASPHPDGVQLRITHQQLAQAVGVARETVSLALTQLRQQNLLRTGRNQLTFNPENLRTFALRHRDAATELRLKNG
jgi:CRP/FNR family cyclic AMP-dependent transcriptional regulator